MSANLEIPGHIALVTGSGGLTKALITTPWSQAEIYLHGAHVTHFQKTGEPPLLFMSAASQFAEGAPIRGGVPLIFPWFGPREGSPAHGYARTRTWELQETAVLSNGAVTLRFALPEAEGYQVEFLVTLTDTLQMELSICNRSAETQQF
jgi:glucose-6-phosphate 1-epimerase